MCLWLAMKYFKFLSIINEYQGEWIKKSSQERIWKLRAIVHYTFQFSLCERPCNIGLCGIIWYLKYPVPCKTLMLTIVYLPSIINPKRISRIPSLFQVLRQFFGDIFNRRLNEITTWSEILYGIWNKILHGLMIKYKIHCMFTSLLLFS
jgi:hypothetical protein